MERNKKDVKHRWEIDMEKAKIKGNETHNIGKGLKSWK